MHAGTTTQADPRTRAAALVEQQGPTLLRVARRVSLCADDAHDAFQRALEIYLRRLDSVDPRTEAAWMRVVVRNEALAVRKARSQALNAEEVDFDAHVDDRQRSPQDRLESAERVSRSSEALRGLKPDEARALLLKAEGLSYTEIGDQLGWTYTKVNRCITEGRARFRKLFGGIESGEQCERFGPLLLALAEGTSGADDLVALRPHLRHCVGCRAEVRRLHGARRPLAAFLPLPAFLERFRPGQVKADLYALFARLGSSEPVAQSIAAGSGGRSAGATALVGICLAGAGAGGYCALGGPLPGAADARDPATRVERRAAQPERAAPVAQLPVRPASASTTAAGATVEPERARRRPAAHTSHREPTAARTTTAGGGEFSFEAAAATAPAPGSTDSAPTARPATTASSPPPTATTSSPTTGAPSGSEFGFER